MSSDTILSLSAAAVVFGSFLLAINWHAIRSTTLRFLDAADRLGAAVPWLRPR